MIHDLHAGGSARRDGRFVTWNTDGLASSQNAAPAALENRLAAPGAILIPHGTNYLLPSEWTGF